MRTTRLRITLRDVEPPVARVLDVPSAATLPELHDERTAALRDLPPTFTYQYDFGDNWDHGVENLGTGEPTPSCVDGEGAYWRHRPGHEP